jgi:hypothetical protein
MDMVSFNVCNCVANTKRTIQGGRHGTAIQAASFWGRPSLVRLLLEHGADPNIQGKVMLTILTSVTCLSVGPGGEDGTALHAALRGGNWERFLEKEAKPPALGPQPSTRAYLNIMKLLMNKGANPNIQGNNVWPLSRKTATEIISQGGRYGTVLQTASWIGNLDAVQLLLANGADPDVTGECFSQPQLAFNGDGKAVYTGRLYRQHRLKGI